MTDPLNPFSDASQAEQRPPLSAGEVWDALVESKGNVSAAAQALGRMRSKVQDKVNQHPELLKLLSDLRETVVDQAESNQSKRVFAGDDPASERYILSTLGKDRGFNQGVSGTGKDGEIVVVIKKLTEEPESGPVSHSASEPG